MTLKRIGLRAVLPVFVLLAAAAHLAADESIPADISRAVRAATVMVRVEYDAPYDNRTSWGTGFVVGNGLIMTNAHVVGDSAPKRIYVMNEYLPATEATIYASRYDPDGKGGAGSTYYDVAVLAYAAPGGARLPVLPFTLNARPSQSVFAFGYPGSERRFHSSPRGGTGMSLGAAPVVTGGAIDQIVQSDPYLVMHSALCQNGNSGGPLVNARGEVVGMQTWSADPDYHNVVESFAIGSGGLAGYMRQIGLRPHVVR